MKKASKTDNFTLLITALLLAILLFNMHITGLFENARENIFEAVTKGGLSGVLVAMIYANIINRIPK